MKLCKCGGVPNPSFHGTLDFDMVVVVRKMSTIALFSHFL